MPEIDAIFQQMTRIDQASRQRSVFRPLTNVDEHITNLHRAFAGANLAFCPDYRDWCKVGVFRPLPLIAITSFPLLSADDGAGPPVVRKLLRWRR